MAELETILSSIGLGHYYCIFVEAGFDTWDTVLGITEDDLASLAVQRGHRRRLQQEIAYSLNNYQSEALGRSPSNAEGSSGAQPGRKRQYTRHPKLDPNAPQRPLSAYVLFSNAMRDEMKDSSPSFAEKSKMVGDRWQSMPEAAKLGWRQKASGQWEKFKTEQAQYQKTDAHRGYQAYLAEFSAAKPSKKRKGPENEPSGQPDDAEPTATVKRSSSSGAQSSSTARPLAPAQGQTPTDPSAVSSPQSTESRKRRGSASNRRECSSATSSAHDKATQWYSHACESCKKKKVKCDGATPSCERCRKSHIECRYAGGVRDKEKRYRPQYYRC